MNKSILNLINEIGKSILEMDSLVTGVKLSCDKAKLTNECVMDYFSDDKPDMTDVLYRYEAMRNFSYITDDYLFVLLEEISKINKLISAMQEKCSLISKEEMVY